MAGSIFEMAAVWVSRSTRCIAPSLASATNIGAVFRLLNASAYHSTASLNSPLATAGRGGGRGEQKPAIFSARRFESMKAAQLAEAPCYSSEDDYDDHYDPNRVIHFILSSPIHFFCCLIFFHRSVRFDSFANEILIHI